MTNPIQKLVDLFSKFPTVGPRTASRFVFYLIKQPKEKIEELISSIQNLKEKIKFCNFCFNPFDPSTSSGQATSTSSVQENFCPICQNTTRDKSLLCIVEKETDLISIEKTGKYKGLYFIIGGTVATLKKSDIEKLRIQDLEKRIESSTDFGIKTDFKEIIIATNPTPEGKATAILINKTLKELAGKKGFKITRLGQGLPVGAELEYADEETLESAFEGRK